MGGALRAGPRAFAALMGSRAVVQISSLVLLIGAARVLQPAEVGNFALASAVGIFITRLAQAGWRQYVLVWNESENPPPTVFWMGVIVAVLGAVVGMLGAGIAIGWFHKVTFGWLLFIFAALIPLTTITTLEYGVLNRRGRLPAVAAIGSAAAILSLLGGFLALMNGFGIFALAVARVIGDGTSLLGSCAAARWIPPPRIEPRLVGRILLFTRKMTLAQLLQFARTYGGEFFIAAFLGLTEVAIYRLGSRICGAVAELLTEPLRFLSWSVFRQARAPGEGRTSVGQAGRDFVFFSMLLAIPAFVGLAAVAAGVVEVFLGPRWSATASVITVLALAQLLAMPGIFSEPLLSLSGAVGKLPLYGAFNVTATLAFLALLAPFGPGWAAVALLLANAALLPLAIRWQSSYGGLDWRLIALPLLPAFAAAAAMAASVVVAGMTFASNGVPSWGALPAQILLGVIIYGILAYGLYPSIRPLIRERLGA